MIRLAAIPAVLLFAVPAYAGCANFTDGSLSAPAPRAVICFDGDCEETTLDWACGNVHGASASYANGWRFDVSDAGETVQRRGTKVDPAKVTCEEVDEGACEGSIPPAR